MKKLLSLTLALMMTAALAIPAFTTGTPPAAPSETTGTSSGISIFTDTAISTNGTWTSPEYSATSSNGNYIRYWHQNDTNEKVKVYLYRTDTKYNTNYVSMMTVNANDQSSKVFYTRTAGSGTYKITIEAYESGGDVNGDAALAQYTSHPDLIR